MKIVVIGPGALGCLMAALITAKAPQQASPSTKIWILDHNPQRAARLSETGLILEENRIRTTWPVQATTDPLEIGTADLILVCVKSRDVGQAVQQALPLSGPNSLLITLQNGIGHLSAVNGLPPEIPLALGITAQGAHLVAPGHVRHAGHGLTRIGFATRPNSRAVALLEKTAALLSRADIQTVVTDTIIDHVWGKLLINVGINALSAIYDCPNGQLLEIPAARKMMEAAVQEAAAVARAQGITIAAEPLAETIEVCRATADNISSMLQDVRHKRPTEIEAINGAVVSTGQHLSIPVETNQYLVQRIREIEKNY